MIFSRPLLLAIGSLLCLLAPLMFFVAIIDFFTLGHEWKGFISAGFITGFCGGLLIIINRLERGEDLGIKQAFILTTLSWITLVLFSSLPLYFSTLELSYTDAFFESMSALTTTGATVLSQLDDMPASLLLWRSLMQWLGGIGIIVMAMAILPMLKIGGMQLFRTESSDKSDKVMPKISHVCSAIGGLYLTLTFICFLCLWKAGMTPFDAVNHAMTTIATAGFSTHDASIGFYHNKPAVEYVIGIFMIISSIPFVLYIQLLRGRTLKLWRDKQVRWFLSILFLSIAATTLWLSHEMHLPFYESFRLAFFNVVSVTTTTGYASSDYNGWGTFIVVFIFLLGVVGGCTGSTTGGIKIFRYQVLFATANSQMKRLVQPNGIFRPIFNGSPITAEESNSVLSFVVLFALSFCGLAILLSITGLDFITAMSGSAAMLANLGPGLGDIIGPNGNYATLPDISKWICTFGMLVGRLEIFTVMILFSPYFWKN